MTDHPITPPPELKAKWAHLPADWDTLASLIAQWGADRQLEADAEWLDQNSLDASHLTITPTGKGLIEAMRPKPPSLKKQALKAAHVELDPKGKNGSLIIRALEGLPE